MIIRRIALVAAGSVDIAEIKYDAIAELSGSSESPSTATATKTTSDGGGGGGGGGGKPRKEVPRNPQTQPDNVCFYRVRERIKYVVGEMCPGYYNYYRTSKNVKKITSALARVILFLCFYE